ncbi:MAG: SDR family oxidoreductase [Isosphaeraceae bacterium]
MFPRPVTHGPDELKVGLAAEFERQVTEEDVLRFAEDTGDFNPLHVDADHGRASNYGGRIVHGAFQVGCASALVGMYLPGLNVLLGQINARFPKPLYYPCRIKVRGEITSWNRQALSGQVRVVVLDAALRVPTAEIVVGFTLHEIGRHQTSESLRVAPSAQGGQDRRVVLVTGASGGLGAEIVRRLAGVYSVVGLFNRQPFNDQIESLESVRALKVDLDCPGWENSISDKLGGRLYGVVHAAWPGAPHGGLLSVEDDVLLHQLTFGTSHTIKLARLLFSLAGSEGGRLIAIGSIVGNQKPVVSLGAYGLGKAALETTMKLLAPELARKGIAVNVVCPAFVATGINKHAGEQQRKMESARVPLGRLCTPADVASVVDYLMSSEAGFISGQVIGLSGGQL